MREEIREKLKQYVCPLDKFYCDDTCCYHTVEIECEKVHSLLTYLDSQGVVIKSNKNNLPIISYNSAYPENEEEYQMAMLRAGYTLVEKLIDE